MLGTGWPFHPDLKEVRRLTRTFHCTHNEFKRSSESSNRSKQLIFGTVKYYNIFTRFTSNFTVVGTFSNDCKRRISPKIGNIMEQQLRVRFKPSLDLEYACFF